MNERQLQMTNELTNRIGLNGQLLNLTKSCSQMAMITTDVLRGVQVSKPVFAEAIADVYVILNAVIQGTQISAAEIEQIATLKLERSLQALTPQQAPAPQENLKVEKGTPAPKVPVKEETKPVTEEKPAPAPATPKVKEEAKPAPKVPTPKVPTPKVPEGDKPIVTKPFAKRTAGTVETFNQ